MVSVAPGRSGPQPTEIVPAGSPRSPGPTTHFVHGWTSGGPPSTILSSLGAKGASVERLLQLDRPAQDQLVDPLVGLAGHGHRQRAGCLAHVRRGRGHHDPRIRRVGRIQAQ